MDVKTAEKAKDILSEIALETVQIERLQEQIKAVESNHCSVELRFSFSVKSVEQSVYRTNNLDIHRDMLLSALRAEEANRLVKLTLLHKKLEEL